MKPRFVALALTALGLAGGLLSEVHAQTSINGWVEVDITTQLVTALPSGGSVLCSVDISGLDPGSPPVPGLLNSDTGVATAAVSGTDASCKVSIPYLWLVVSPTTATLSVTYTVSMFSGAASTTTLVRNGTHSLESIPLPADGVSRLFTAVTKL